MKITITHRQAEYVIIDIDLENQIVDHSDLVDVNAPDIITEQIGNKGVVLSGRAPIWLYAYLVHYYHPTKWIAIYDPRLAGAVVTSTHDSGMQVGDVIKDEIWKNG